VSGLFVERRTRGLGDAVMLTSAVASLRNTLGSDPVTVAIADSLHPTFLHHPSIDHLTTPERGGIPPGTIYVDCSSACARYEHHHQPLIVKNRPQIWVESAGQRWDRSPPKIHLSPAEWKAVVRMRGDFDKPIVGVGYASVDAWRTYKHVDLLIRRLRKMTGGTVLVFHDKPTRVGRMDGIRQCVGEGLREYFKKVALCDLMVSPDTAHVHVAAALEVPVYFIDGPTDAEVRMDGYDVPYSRPPRYTACGRQPSWYRPCKPCWCLEALRPGVVASGAVCLLREEAGGFARRLDSALRLSDNSGEVR